jgi:hypothetical protein
MAIKHKYAAGGATTVISLAASLAAGANTYSGHSGITQTPLDNSTDKYPHVRLVLEVPESFAAVPAANGWFDIWMTLNNVDGSNHETPLPGATDIESLAVRIAQIRIDNQDVAQRKAVNVLNCLAGVEHALFYVRNMTSQATTYSSTPLTLKVTPFTFEDA